MLVTVFLASVILHCDGRSVVVSSDLQRSKPVSVHIFHDLKWVKKESWRLHQSGHSIPVEFAIQTSICMQYHHAASGYRPVHIIHQRDSGATAHSRQDLVSGHVRIVDMHRDAALYKRPDKPHASYSTFSARESQQCHTPGCIRQTRRHAMRDTMAYLIVHPHHAQPVLGYFAQPEFLRQVHEIVDVFAQTVLICVYNPHLVDGADGQARVRRDDLRDVWSARISPAADGAQGVDGGALLR